MCVCARRASGGRLLAPRGGVLPTADFIVIVSNMIAMVYYYKYIIILSIIHCIISINIISSSITIAP